MGSSSGTTAKEACLKNRFTQSNRNFLHSNSRLLLKRMLHLKMRIRTTTHILGIAALDMVSAVEMVVATVMVVRHDNETRTRGYPLEPIPTLTKNTQVDRVRLWVRVQGLPDFFNQDRGWECHYLSHTRTRPDDEIIKMPFCYIKIPG